MASTKNDYHIIIKQSFIDNTKLIEEHSELYAGDGVHLLAEFYPYWAQNQLLGIYDLKNGRSSEGYRLEDKTAGASGEDSASNKGKTGGAPGDAPVSNKDKTEGASGQAPASDQNETGGAPGDAP